MKWFISLLLVSTYSLLFGQILELEGKIHNPNSSYLILRTSGQMLLDSMLLDANNEVFTSLEIDAGEFELFDGEEYKSIYLKPDYKLSFTFDASQFDETFSFQGIGSEVNNYMAQAYLLDESLGKYDYYAYIYKLDEQRFLHIVDSVFQLKMNLLNTFNQMDKDVFELKKLDLVFSKDHKLYSYQNSYRYFRDSQNFVVTKNFPNPFSNLNLERKDLLALSSYVQILSDYVNAKATQIKANNDSLDFFLARLSAIEQHILIPEIREAAIQYSGKNYFMQSKNRKEAYERILDLSTDSVFKDDIHNQDRMLNRIDAGSISPPFTFTDSTGSSVSLKDLEGKYVYIDIWATWCAPCVKEIPHFKQLVKKYATQNIVFVSIARNDDKDRWRKKISQDSLPGIQLFAEDSNADFFEAFIVNSIPRYILIAPDGKIVDSDAKRPSNILLIEQLDGLLR